MVAATSMEAMEDMEPTVGGDTAWTTAMEDMMVRRGAESVRLNTLRATVSGYGSYGGGWGGAGGAGGKMRGGTRGGGGGRGRGGRGGRPY